MAEPSPRSATNSAPFLLRETAPPVFVSRWTILARPVEGSSCMTLLASLFANNTVPLSPAIGPSTLLPSHDQTTFHDCPAASTPAIAAVAGMIGSGGAAFAFADCPAPGIEKGCGGFLHFASTFFSPGFCQLCMLLPRGNEDDGLCAKTSCRAADDYRESDLRFHSLIRFDRTSQFEFVQSLQFLPTNIAPALLSLLNVHLSQFDATLANSPPPG